MPIGGTHHCASCRHFVRAEGRCALRNLTIKGSLWTTCRDLDRETKEPHGPLYAMVCEVRNGGGAYYTIPYWKGVAPRLEQSPPMADTVVVLSLPDQTVTFDTVEECLPALEAAGLER